MEEHSLSDEKAKTELKEAYRQKFMANCRFRKAKDEMTSRVDKTQEIKKKKPRVMNQFLTKSQVKMMLMVSNSKIERLSKEGALPDFHPVTIARYLRTNIVARQEVEAKYNAIYEDASKRRSAYLERLEEAKEELAKRVLRL